MRKVIPSFLTIVSCSLPFSHSLLHAENKADNKTEQPSTNGLKKAMPTFEPFTGKITKNKVRLRLQPNFDSPVIRELSRNDLLIINGEADDFYTIQPLPDMKAYVYRTYVLDNVIEGTKVNVRLKPDLDSPVIAQLNSGDHVTGVIDASNNKWLEISIPSSAQFYVAKDYIEKVGDANYVARMEKRRDEATRLFNTTNAVSATEMQKPFDQVNLDGIIANYKHIMLDYPDFPEAAAKAQEALADLQQAYMDKKIAFLENQTNHSSILLESKNKQMENELKTHKSKISQLEQQLQQEKSKIANVEISSTVPTLPGRKTVTATYPVNMLSWMPVEDAIFNSWSQQTGNPNIDSFYQEQKKKSFVVAGIIEPYNRSVKNKPGDYMIIHPVSRLPIAFLYSTVVNLQEYVGHEVSISVSSRPNNHFAYPAYFVLSIE